MRRAPRDFRKPISRVRSVTLASMMFMMTTPPTTRKTQVIQMAMANTFPVIRFQSPVIELGAMTAKLSSASYGTWRRARIMTRASSSDSGIRSGLGA